MRKLYWYLTAYLRKHGLKFLTAVILGVAFFSFLIPVVRTRLAHRETHYVALIGEYSLRNLPEIIKSQLSQSLVVASSDGTFVPQLADKLTIDPDGLKYTFTFEHEARWGDGKNFVTTDVNYPVREAQVTFSTNQIVYDLPEVFASFPQLLTEPLLKYETQKRWGLFEREMVYGLSKTLVQDYKYADKSRHNLKEIVLLDQQDRQRWVYRFYYTQEQAITAYKLGEVDILYDIAGLGELKDWATTSIQERTLPDQYLAVFFNTSDELLTSKNLRLALSYGVEKERPGYARALGPISESSWAFFKGIKRYDKNIGFGVERLLEELPGAPLELKITTTTSYNDIAAKIKQEWEELGAAAAEACLESETIDDKTACEYLRLRVTIQLQAFPDTNNYQVLLLGQQVSTDPDQYALWHSGLATNFTHYKNTKVDSLLERGRQSVDTKERLTIYQEFQQDLLEDPPAIFLWYLKSSDLVRSRR